MCVIGMFKREKTEEIKGKKLKELCAQRYRWHGIGMAKRIESSMTIQTYHARANQGIIWLCVAASSYLPRLMLLNHGENSPSSPIRHGRYCTCLCMPTWLHACVACQRVREGMLGCGASNTPTFGGSFQDARLKAGPTIQCRRTQRI